MSPRTLGDGRAKGVRRHSITRARLLDAAETLFTNQGFHATSVGQIAATAGYTTGAVYSSFAGKDELFFAVVERRRAQQGEAWRAAAESIGRGSGVADAMGAAMAAATPDPGWVAAFWEFVSFAARNEQLRDRIAAEFKLTIEGVAERLGPQASSAPLPLDRLAAIVTGLMQGLALMGIVDTEAGDSSVFADGVAVLLGVSPQTSKA